MSDAISKLTLGRAKSAVLARDFTLAENLFKSLLEKEPDNIELLGELGNLCQKTARDEEALSSYQQILEIDDKNLMAMNSLGSIYRKLKRYRESVSILEQGIIVDEHNIQLFYNLGFTYKEMKKYPGAIHCFEMVIAHNKDDVLAYNHLGSIYNLQGDYSKAVETLNRGLKIDPNHPVLHLNLAKAYEAVGNIETATLEYEAALRSKPGWFEAIDGYADLLLSKDNALHAQDLVGQALSLHPENAGMHTKMGHVFTQLDSYSEAQAQFNEALTLEPDNTDALSGLANAYELDGKVLDALHTMETYEKLSPEDVDMLRQYTHILLTSNKLAAAYDKIQKVLERNPEDVKTLNLMGQYYICSGEEDMASECFQQIRSIDPSYVAYYKDGALRYDQKGDHAKAEEGLKKYLDVRPYDSRALSMLASNYEKQERYDDAQKIYSSLSEKYSGNPSYKQKLDNVSKKIPVAVPQSLDFEQALAEEAVGENDTAVFSSGVEGAQPIDVSEDAVQELETAEADGAAEKETLGYNLESLTKDDGEVTPFANQLDDEIEASRSDDNSLDALISEDDRLDQLEDEADFFKDNPFGSAPAASHERPEEDDRMFQAEDLDDGEDRSSPVGLDEDVQTLDDGEDEEDSSFNLEPESSVQPEPEDVAEPKEAGLDPVEEELPEVESSDELEVLPEPEADDVEVLAEPEVMEEAGSEPEELAEAEDEELEVLPEPEEVLDSSADAEAEEFADAESVDVEVLPDPEEAVPDLEEEEAEELPEPEELELDPDDMEAGDDTAGGVEQELLPSEGDIEEPDVVEDGEVSEPLIEDFLDDLEDELSMELSEIEDAITDRRAAEQYKKAADMLRQLRSLADYLPADKKALFMQGENRLRLEWVISRLEGKPGLMAVAEAWRKDFDLEKPFSEPEEAKDMHGLPLVKYVLEYMRNIIGALDDVYLAACLGNKVEDLLAKLGE